MTRGSRETENQRRRSAASAAKALNTARSRSGAGPRAKTASRRAREVPWLTITAGVVILALVGVLAYYLVPQYQDRARAQQFVPTSDNPDPSSGIDGVVTASYPSGQHVTGEQRVAYDKLPPFGGPHDQVWATCTGTVYPGAIRAETAVHSLEHGAVWVAYNPETVPTDQVQVLKNKVSGKPYLMMSPVPGLPSPISVQSWGHQLALTGAEDKRIDQFISALRLNPNTYPEVGASCSTGSLAAFDPDKPPPFDPTPAVGPDAVPMDRAGTDQGAG